MATRYDILMDEQRRLLPALAPLKELGFVLYGGTAIALQIGHRESIDFDFFSDHPMDREAMRAALPWLDDAETLQDQPDAWSLHAKSRGSNSRPVKLSFFSGLRFGRVGTPSRDDDGHLILASMDDLLGHKLKVLLQRVEAKDYQDIAAMLRSGQTLGKGLAASAALFSNFPPCEALKALVYFDDDALFDLSVADRAELVTKGNEVTKHAPLAILSRHLDR